MSTQLSLSQAAKVLKVSEKSIRRYIKAGRLKAALVKGEKGYEYRIDRDKLKILDKPARGKPSHKNQLNKKTYKQVSNKSFKHVNKKTSTQNIQKAYKKPDEQQDYVQRSDMDNLSQLAEERYQKILQQSRGEMGSIDYKLLYEKLLAKYEQSLIMIGSLEAQIKNLRSRFNQVNPYEAYQAQPKQIPQLSADTLAKNEEMILELYQMLKNEREDLY